MGEHDYIQIIHRFWAGPEMPDDYAIFGQMWEDLNPGWQVVTWDESVLDDFPELGAVFRSLYARDDQRHGIELYVQLADVIGYALVEKWGGVYVNCDMQPLRPLPALAKKAWASLENSEDIVNAAFGAPQPRNVFWTGLLEELPRRYFANPTAEMVLTTGPSLLTAHARANPDKIHVYPVEMFNPIHWKEIPAGGDASAFLLQEDGFSTETVAVHHWGHKRDGRSNTVETATR